jgi:superfamily II DNA or RNA helicase
MQLREHQKQAIARAFTAIEQHKKPLVIVGTGGGKTAIGAAMAQVATKQGRRTIIVCPFVPLIGQQAKELLRFGFSKDEIGILQGDNSDDTGFLASSKVVVAMAQSLNSDRGKQMLLAKRFDICILDERHLGHLDKAEAKVNAPVNIGFTATPLRAKGQEILDEYEWIEPTSTRKLIREEYLSQFRHYIYSQTHLINPEGSGDYSDAEQRNILQNITPEFVFKEWQRICTPRKGTIGFCGSIQQAEEYADYWKRQGCPAEVVCKDTPDEDRMKVVRTDTGFDVEEERIPGFRTIRERFREGEISAIFSVTKLATGFDEPTSKYALILRPTVSEALWIQMFGRVLRIIPGVYPQPIAHILDFAGCGLRLPLPTEIESYEEYIVGKKRKVSRQPIIRRDRALRQVSVSEFISRHLSGKMVARRDPYLISDDVELLRELRHQAFWIHQVSPSFAWSGYCKIRKVEHPPKWLWIGEKGALDGAIFESPTIEHFMAYLQYLRVWKSDRKNPEAWLRDEVRKEFGIQGLIWLRQVSVMEN